MSKSQDAKPSVHAAPSRSTSELDKVVLACQLQAKALLPTVSESYNPVAVRVHANAAIAQLALAAGDKTPRLLLFKGEPQLTWSALLEKLLQLALAEASKPGGQVERPVVPEENRIEPAIAEAEAARRRVVQAVEGKGLDAVAVQALKVKVFGDRKLVSGKAHWQTEISSIIVAVEALGPDAPPALLELLPRLRASALQLSEARPQPGGQPRKQLIYSPEAIEAAVAVDVALDELVSWAAATATESRNDAILRAANPKRRGDAKASGGGDEGGGTGAGTGGAGTGGAGASTSAGEA